jgi:hypothetical protein
MAGKLSNNIMSHEPLFGILHVQYIIFSTNKTNTTQDTLHVRRNLSTIAIQPTNIDKDTLLHL